MTDVVRSSKTNPHTPGPWEAVQSPLEGADVRLKRRHWQIGSSATRKGVALAFGDDGANAALIAAVPDLLALAKQYASECSGCDGEGRILVTFNDREAEYDPCEDCAGIRAVIAKAESGHV